MTMVHSVTVSQYGLYARMGYRNTGKQVGETLHAEYETQEEFRELLETAVVVYDADAEFVLKLGR